MRHGTHSFYLFLCTIHFNGKRYMHSFALHAIRTRIINNFSCVFVSSLGITHTILFFLDDTCLPTFFSVVISCGKNEQFSRDKNAFFSIQANIFVFIKCDIFCDMPINIFLLFISSNSNPLISPWKWRIVYQFTFIFYKWIQTILSIPFFSILKSK